MIKGDIKTKLNEVLGRFGMDPLEWTYKTDGFKQKLEFLFESNGYNQLFNALFSSNDLIEFNSYVFEVLFAHDFESKGHKLLYEVRQLTEENTSVDFCYNLDDQKKVYFELGLIGQRSPIKNYIESQLKISKHSEILLNGQDEIDETIRLQSFILSKCQDDNGKPIKFYKVTEGVYNFVVVNVSELHLNMIDREDCELAMYGNTNLSIYYHGHNILGLCQQLGKDASDDEKRHYHKFQHFRETIHGVLFVKFAKKNDDFLLSNMHIDRELEYFPTRNEYLLQKQDFDLIAERLSSFLKKGHTKKNKNAT